MLKRDAWVAHSREEAERVYGPEVMTAYKYYWRNQALAFQGTASENAFTLENLAGDRLILGTPDECVQQLHRWREALDTNYVLLRLRHAHSGGPPHAEIMPANRPFRRTRHPAAWLTGAAHQHRRAYVIPRSGRSTALLRTPGKKESPFGLRAWVRM